MTSRPLRVLVAVCLLILLAVHPTRPSSNVRVAESSQLAQVPYAGPSSKVDWQAIGREAERLRLERFYAWAASQPVVVAVTTPRVEPEGMQGATEESQHAAHFDPGSVQQIIVDVFGPTAPAALKVAKCESGYRPDAVNGQYRGIFQLGNYHRARAERLGYSWAQMFEAYPNVVVAHDLWLEQGWRPWECRP